MPEHVLDCRGLPCPQPVLQCKACLEAPDAPTAFTVLVDNEAAKENVGRFLSRQGVETRVGDGDGGLYRIIASRGAAGEKPQAPTVAAACSVLSPEPSALQTLVFVASDTVGRGDEELGAKLMLNFVSTLPELGESLWRIILVNAGVKLAVEGSLCLEKLQSLSAAGVSILVCGTCLDHFGLLEQKRVGETTNMLDVVTSMQLADKVIRV
jgi:selenium metabolism protein YedF